MWKPDPDIWNRKTILTVTVLLIIALNIDIYGSAYTLWMSLHKMSSLIIGMAMITTFVEVNGWTISGVLIDRYGTKKVQFFSLLILLISGATGAMLDGLAVLCCLLVRFMVCQIALTANTIQIRDLLPEEKQGRGFGQLFMVGFFGGVVGAAIGSWLASDYQAVWKWVGPILTIFGIVVLMYTQQSNRVPEKASIRPHPEVIRLSVPLIGIMAIQSVFITFVVIDLGVENGTFVRVGSYAGSGLAGLIVPFLLKHIKENEKAFIRYGVIVTSASLLFLYWPNVVGLIVASFVIGIIFNGIQTQILGTKVYLLTDQKGRAASTSRLVQGAGRIIGIYGLGMIRDHIGKSMWLVLPIILLASLPVFEWTFRHCPAWKK
ncbi:MFS transporter [Shimazuella sp. AN120528]|uniref:MFS transporter n=1 Tax=Shimazuella soli TaxID=1892854 RepID=UPI001F10E44C|nr:MFS transporter [Shimazuella soli]MCH5584933.1 MFS transporter [Shimazuella soli]